MKISFYQIPHILISNSSYFGSLIEQKSEDVNVNLENLSQFSILLSSSYMDYNYIKVERGEDIYYYLLEGYKYYDASKSHFNYKMDILRTVHEMDMENHELRVNRFSNLLTFTPEQNNYFWKNQEIKLNSNIIEKYSRVNLKYSDDPNIQSIWEELRWVYIWLQPKVLGSYTVGSLDFPFHYKISQMNKESIINVTSQDLPIGMRSQKWTKSFIQTSAPYLHTSYANGQQYVRNFWYDYPVGQLYYLTDAQMYVRFVERRLKTWDSGQYLFGKKEMFRLFLTESISTLTLPLIT